MQLDIGSRVRTRDGANAGKIKRIIFDSDNMTVRQFVVQAGVLLPSERIVDLSLIDGISEDHTVTLLVSASAIDDLPAFVGDVNTPIFYSSLHNAHELGVISRAGSIPRDAVVLGHGAQVYDRDDEHLGHLDEVVYGERGVATAFVIDTGILLGRKLVIPVSAIGSITHARIELKVRAASVDEGRTGLAAPAA